MQITLDYEFRPLPRYGHGKSAHVALNQLIEKSRPAFEKYLDAFIVFQPDLLGIPVDENPDAPGDPHWGNGYFPGLDAVSLHCMLSMHRPRIFCEIGSGHSTRFARHAIEIRGLATQIISIDPHPRAEIDAICDTVVREPVEDLAPEYFDMLASGDVLFIDSSHRAFTNSDVTAFYLDILPRLKAGVMIQIHDIFLPYDYPPEWADRYYNEQYLLACTLLTRYPSYEIHLANTFISYDPELSELAARIFDHPGLVDASQHDWITNTGWSLWMKRL
jgi:Methyltransferase domain